jgi:hypothetical protein
MPTPASSFSSGSKSPYNDLDKDVRRIPLVKRFQQLPNNRFNKLSLSFIAVFNYNLTL